MKIIQHSRRVKVEQYYLFFEDRECLGAGFSFECDREGNILLDKIHPAGRENLEKCLSGEYNVENRGVRDCSYSYLEHMTIQCECGERFQLCSIHTNECEKCGILYNGYGQELAPRHMWSWVYG